MPADAAPTAVPPWLVALPRFELLDGPSPLQRADRFAAALGGRGEVWLKREDLLPLAFGGNKLRNLEFLVGEALAEGADTLVTVGRRWSNHCRLTAAAGARAGLAVHLVLSGQPATSPPGVNERLDTLLGATLHRSGPSRSEREALLAEVVDGLRDGGARPYVIPAGGSTVIGAAGELLAGLELAGQMPPEAPADLVVLPSATGGTQAGLIVGLALAGWSTRVLGVAVAHPSPDLRPGVEQLSAELAARSAVEPEQLAPIEIDDRWLGRGYGEPSEAAEEATTLLARTEGVFVDPIYTAKALAALIALVQSGEVDGQRVVFWHAGGTPALFEEHAG